MEFAKNTELSVQCTLFFISDFTELFVNFSRVVYLVLIENMVSAQHMFSFEQSPTKGMEGVIVVQKVIY